MLRPWTSRRESPVLWAGNGRKCQVFPLESQPGSGMEGRPEQGEKVEAGEPLQAIVNQARVTSLPAASCSCSEPSLWPGPQVR